MRRLTAQEVLSLTKLMQMETGALAMAKASVSAMQDKQLKTLNHSGITAGEARIRGLQQFISENDVIPKEVER